MVFEEEINSIKKEFKIDQENTYFKAHENLDKNLNNLS
jgi:uncharacterized protein involved in tellurium resistance